MALFKIKILVFPETLELYDNLKNNIKKYFSEFSSYLTVDTSISLPTIIPVLEFPSVKDISAIENAADIVSKYFSSESDNILLVGIYKNLFQPSSDIRVAHSFIDNTAYVFANYETKNLLSTNETLISSILINEFVNYLFFQGEKELETHTGDCVRTLSKDQIHFCSVCSEKIHHSLVKLASESKITEERHPDQTVSKENTEFEKQTPRPSNLVQQASQPPPKRTQLLEDPNSNLTFNQRKLINKFLKDGGIRKEPLEDPEYLEIRQRFFDGKISDQVFLQMLKRKAKY